MPASLSGRPWPSAHGPRPPFTLCQLEYSLNCRLRPPCGAIVSEFRPRIHVAGHGGDATSPAPNVAPRSQKLRPHGAKLGAKTPFSTHCPLPGRSCLSFLPVHVAIFHGKAAGVHQCVRPAPTEAYGKEEKQDIYFILAPIRPGYLFRWLPGPGRGLGVYSFIHHRRRHRPAGVDAGQGGGF